MKRFLIGLIFISVVVSSAHAQFGSNWRKYRHELVFGVGTTSFLGELGGADGPGTHFVKDFEISSSRPLMHVAYRYKLSPSFSVKAGFWYGWLSGDDAKSGDDFRKARNLSFRSPLLEASANIEWYILKERYTHRYDLRRVRGAKNKPALYLFTGVSGIWFNPKAKYTDGKWYALQPLGTEGQGIVSTREKYSRISWAIPVGFGMDFLLSRRVGLGFEYGTRFTMTDYIDDVSTSYVDKNLFTDPIAAYFSDRSDNWAGSGPYNQRGNSRWNDAYMFLTLNLTYKFVPRIGEMPKF